MELLQFALIGVALGLSLGLFGGGGGILAIPLLVAAGTPPTRPGPLLWWSSGSGRSGGCCRTPGPDGWPGGRGSCSAPWARWAPSPVRRLALFTDDRIQLWGFTVVLIVAGSLMLRNALRTQHGGTPHPDRRRRSWWLVVTTALTVGLFTGFFGVGGGFLVVPALALVMGMTMYQATATALLVITLNSAVALIPRAGRPWI